MSDKNKKEVESSESGKDIKEKGKKKKSKKKNKEASIKNLLKKRKGLDFGVRSNTIDIDDFMR